MMMPNFDMDIPLISLQVTPDIAAKLLFMSESGLFAIRTGNASLNFHEGVLKSIKTELLSYPQIKTIDSVHTGLILK